MKSILLVEDSKFLRLASARALVKSGYSVIASGDGEHALRAAKECLPDLILLDMLLPKLGGLEVLRALKKDPVTARIPVVVLTGLSDTNETKLAGDGAAAFLTKSKLSLEGDCKDLTEAVAKVLASPSLLQPSKCAEG